MSDTEDVQPCPDAVIDFTARDGRLVLTMREAPGAPTVTVACGYGDCLWVMAAIQYALRGKTFDRLLSRDAASSEDRQLLFARVSATPGVVTWEVAAPFRIAGWRFDMKGDELAALEIATRQAMRQEDARL